VTPGSGRAEIGLTGNDDFHFMVSPNGASWIDAITVDKRTGYAGFGTASPEVPFHVNAGPANVAFRPQGTDPTIVFQIMDDTTLARGNGPIFLLRARDNAQFYTPGQRS